MFLEDTVTCPLLDAFHSKFPTGGVDEKQAGYVVSSCVQLSQHFWSRPARHRRIPQDGVEIVTLDGLQKLLPVLRNAVVDVDG